MTIFSVLVTEAFRDAMRRRIVPVIVVMSVPAFRVLPRGFVLPCWLKDNSWHENLSYVFQIDCHCIRSEGMMPGIIIESARVRLVYLLGGDQLPLNANSEPFN